MTRLRAIGMLLAADLFAAIGFPLVKAVALLHQRLLPAGGGWFVTADLGGPRFLLSIPILWWWQRRQGPEKRITPKEWRQGAAIGFFSAGGIIVLSDALRFAPASTSAFFATLYAVLVPAWLALWQRRIPPRTVWVSCALVLTGVAILGRFDWRELRFGRGESEALLSAVFFMGQLLTLDRKSFAGNRAGSVTLVMFITASAILGVLTVATMPDVRALIVPWTSPAWIGLTLLLTVVATLAPCVMVNVWQTKITATEAGLIYCVEPIFGALLVLFLPAWLSHWSGIAYANETATFHLLAGGGLITLANILIHVRPAAGPAAA